MGGVGGTMAGNALSVAAMRATLEEVLTDAGFAHMNALAARYTAGVQDIMERAQLPWSISRIASLRLAPSI